jgi:flavin-dependent dehydrogenase
MSDVDVAVVGAGPAGCATAIVCARAGLRVEVLERSLFPRDRPGETLHPGVEPLLRQLEVWDRVLSAGFLRHEGNRVTWGAEPRFQAFGSDARGPWLGMQAWRADLDRIMIDAARDAGAAIAQPERATGILEANGRVIGVRTESRTLRAKVVVDAAGGGHWLGRALGLKRVHRSPRLIARYGYAHADAGFPETAPTLTADETGWTWIARVKPTLLAWTRLNVVGAPQGRDWRPETLKGLAPYGNSHGADVRWRALDPPAGNGYFVVGDAAAVLDPAASHGVLKALMSGMLAARRILQSLREGVDEEEAAADYSQWVRAWFTHDVHKLTELYAIFPTFAAEREREIRASKEVVASLPSAG